MVDKVFIVVGLGYGDEGKGLTTDYLCSMSSESLVIRYNGGQQAGHCVVMQDGREHVFSNFGSGTFRNVPTFWSKFCTFSPEFFVEEFELLNFDTVFFIDVDCPITTHYDILYNRTLEDTLGKNRHGSCGLGFGATIAREENGLNFNLNDLLEVDVVRIKLKQFREYYRYKINVDTVYDFDRFNHAEEDGIFLNSVERLKKLISNKIVVPTCEKDLIQKSNRWSTLIFEGAQGILLDRTFGKKPYVTKSNCTSQNAFEMLQRNQINCPTEVCYVTRSYSTRHGAGPFNETPENFTLLNTSTETNIYNRYQGVFKISYLQIDELNYALKCDELFSKDSLKNLFITCLDQIGDKNIPVFIKDEVRKIDYQNLHYHLEANFQSVKYSFGRTSEDIK